MKPVGDRNIGYHGTACNCPECGPPSVCGLCGEIKVMYWGGCDCGEEFSLYERDLDELEGEE